jgi:hypothetical protein
MSDEGKGPAKREVPTPRRRQPGDKPFIPFVRYEDLVVKCGHVVQFGLMPDNKDRFREDRRKKAASRDCKACREKRQQEQLEALERKRAEKEQRKSQQVERGLRPGKDRLPDGSRFEVVYDAAMSQWKGTLTVPSPGGAPITFSGARSALFKLLAKLDEQYRETLS